MLKANSLARVRLNRVFDRDWIKFVETPDTGLYVTKICSFSKLCRRLSPTDTLIHGCSKFANFSG